MVCTAGLQVEVNFAERLKPLERLYKCLEAEVCQARVNFCDAVAV